MLYEYDQAAWHATDAVQAIGPDHHLVGGWVARKTPAGWVVVFGKLSEDKASYQVAYEASAPSGSQKFVVIKDNPPREEKGEIAAMARAFETARNAFRGENRPYNIAVLPAPGGKFWVYVMPGSTKYRVYPHGGDVRYVISSDGRSIEATRQLHRSILKLDTSSLEQKPEMGFHVAVMDDIPEDTDVFLVLWREPSIPEMIATKKYAYKIETSGEIKYLGETEKVLKR